MRSTHIKPNPLRAALWAYRAWRARVQLWAAQ